MASKLKTRKKQTLKKEVKKRKNAVRVASKTRLRATASVNKKPDAGRVKVKPEGLAPAAARITPQKGPTVKIASRTVHAPKENNDRNWLLLDGKNQTVGRLASEISLLLRGKHKASYTPNNDVGDFVVVVNADKVRFTKNKEETKEYFHHSGWIGGKKLKTPAVVRASHPERILESAVRGMINRNSLGRSQMKKLKLYAGQEHPHAAQNPKVWELRYHKPRA